MSNIPERWDGTGQWYFVTVVAKKRNPVFREKENCENLLTSFHETYNFHPFRLAGLVILPEHWHGIILPLQEKPIETIVGSVKRNFLERYASKRGKKTIWQERFLDRRIRNEEEFNHYLEYIRINPEKHEQVDSTDKWPWCFFHFDPLQKKF